MITKKKIDCMINQLNHMYNELDSNLDKNMYKKNRILIDSIVDKLDALKGKFLYLKKEI